MIDSSERNKHRWIDMEAVHSLKAVVSAGSISAAARRTGVTQAAISLRIKRLEASLNTKVLKRGKGETAALTDNGILLLRYYKEVVDLDFRLRKDLERLKTNRFSLRLGIQSDIRKCDLPKTVSSLKDIFDNVFIRTDCSNKLRNLVQGGDLDIAVVTSFEQVGIFIREANVRWIRAVGSSLYSQRPLPIVFTSDSVFGEKAKCLLDRSGISWQQSFEARSVLEVDLAVQADIGLSAGLVEDRAPGTEDVPMGLGLPPFPPISIRLLRSSAANLPDLDFVERKLIDVYRLEDSMKSVDCFDQSQIVKSERFLSNTDTDDEFTESDLRP